MFTVIKLKILMREFKDDLSLGLTSDFSDNFSPNCFSCSGGDIWSISAPNIAIGTFTSETMNFNIWDNIQSVTNIYHEWEMGYLPLIWSSVIGPGCKMTAAWSSVELANFTNTTPEKYATKLDMLADRALTFTMQKPFSKISTFVTCV